MLAPSPVLEGGIKLTQHLVRNANSVAPPQTR